MGTIHLLTHDPLLRAICEAELTAMGQAFPATVTTGANVPSDCPVLILDLDTFSVPVTQGELPPVVAVTRKEAELAGDIRASFAAVLHRPFSIEAFRETLLPFLAPKLPAPHAKQKRHRVTARRSTAKREYGTLKLSEARNALLCGTHTIPLTPAEAAVFLALSRANGEPVSRETLLSVLHAENESNLPDVHVCAIRKKLAPFGKDMLIHTVRGLGYRLLEK